MRTINNNLEHYKLFASRFTYDPDTGKFTNILTGYSGHKPQSNGYTRLSTRVNGKGIYIKAHRLAWFIQYGEMPAETIDHLNGDKSDNRLSNIECVSSRVNTTRRSSDNRKTSLYTGVAWHKFNKKWHAQIRIDGKVKHLGYFKNEFVAANAYANALSSLSNTMH